VGHEDTAFVAKGNGLTDLVKRPTRRAAELTAGELADGAATLRDKIKDWKPAIVLFAFKPPAELLCGRRKTKPGLCGEIEGVPAFLLTGPYSAAEEAARVDRELQAVLKTLNSSRNPTTSDARVLRQAVVPEALASFRGVAPNDASGRTQRITETDLAHRRIRLPRGIKGLLPACRSQITVELRGTLMKARYDPRKGPDRERSATLVFQQRIANVVGKDEVLQVGISTSADLWLR
jgi:hypothetical protein